MSIDHFLDNLNRVADTISPIHPLQDFISDLDRVHNTPAIRATASLLPGAAELAMLGERFHEIQKTAVGKLGGTDWLKNVPDFDPLRCRVGLFTTLELGRHETAHTSALAWLLNPDEDHGFNDVLLRPLLRHLFNLNTEPVVAGVNTINEFPTAGQRGRLDVHITGEWKVAGSQNSERFRVIIEAKIDADEGIDQCTRYEEHASVTQQANERLCLVYLTREGRDPATASKGGPSPWKTISFLNLMALFRHQLDHLREKPGFHFLRLYMSGVLRDFYKINCGSPDLTSNLYTICKYLTQFTQENRHHA